FRESVKQLGHPPGESFGLPDAGESPSGIGVEAGVRLALKVFDQSLREICDASPARNSRPNRIGSATKLRSGAMLFSIEGPVRSATAAFGSIRRLSSS